MLRTMKITMMLWREHRQIEQGLALLGDLHDVSLEDFAPLAADLEAHLAAEESVLYPVAEVALGGNFEPRQAVHARVRAAVTEAVGARDALVFRERLAALARAFAAHAQFEESTVHGALERAMNDESLESLGAKARAFRVAARVRAA